MLKGKVILPLIVWLDMLDMLALNWCGWRMFPQLLAVTLADMANIYYILQLLFSIKKKMFGH